MCMGGALGEMIGGKASGVGLAKKAGLPGLAGGVAGMLLKKRKGRRPTFGEPGHNDVDYRSSGGF